MHPEARAKGDYKHRLSDVHSGNARSGRPRKCLTRLVSLARHATQATLGGPARFPAPATGMAMTRTDIPTRPRRQLSMRLLAWILLVSSLVTLLLTAWQLWADFDRDLDGIEERLDILEHTTLEPLSNSVWALNEEQIRLLLTGMLNLEAIVAVELRTDQGREYRFGTLPDADDGVTRHYALTYRGQAPDSQPYPLGQLTIHTSLDGVYARLLDRAATILVGQALKTFVVSIFILLIVQQLVTRHLGKIADYARGLSPATLDRPLVLDRAGRPDREPDELDRVESAINFMRETLIADIARREAAERRLRESEARYRQLFQGSTDGLAIFDLDGRLLTANPAFLAMLGYPQDELPPLTQATMTPEQWREADGRILETQVLPRGYSDEYRKELRQRDGSHLPVSACTWTVSDENGSLQFLMTRVRDISREQRLEEERRRIRQHLQESQRLETIGTLAGGVAHEFNNLLTPIKGYAELLAREPGLPPQAATRAEAILHAAERGRKLVEKILLLGRRGPAQRVTVNVAALARDTLELAGLTRPPNVRTSISVRTPGTELVADPAQLHQALMNLLLNAFSATRDGGEVDVLVEDCELEGRAGLAITVHDTGTGIAPDILRRIFEPFFSTRSPAEGSGLGLAVVHGIVKGHEGDIQVESRPGDTRFRLWLPRAAAGSAPAAASEG